MSLLPAQLPDLAGQGGVLLVEVPARLRSSCVRLIHGIAPSADVEFETRSFPNLLVATLATLPSVSEIPFLDSRERLRLVDCNCASVDSEILP
jgi:hypothetical protein